MPNSTCSRKPTGGATAVWPPPHPPASSVGWRPATGHMSGSRTGSDVAKTSVWDGYRRRQFNINCVWLELALSTADLIAWTQAILLDGELAQGEPNTLRYRLLHVAARLNRGQRRTRMRLPANWPWRHQLLAAFHTLARLPRPMRIQTEISTPAHLRPRPPETRTPRRLHRHAHTPPGTNSSPKTESHPS